MKLEINTKKTKEILEICKINISSIKDHILTIPKNDWNDTDSEKANYNKDGVLKQTQHIIFKFSNKKQVPITYFDLPVWDKWKDKLLPVMNEVTQHYGYTNGFYPRVMLAKLPPGAKIPPHIDGNILQNRPHKIHIPIQTNPDAWFFQSSKKYNLKEGYAYEVNNATLHAVKNDGNCDRIHLIFEYLEIPSNQ